MEKDRTVVEEVVLCKILDNATDKQLSLESISGKDLKEYYSNLVTWLYKLKVLSITNIHPEKALKKPLSRVDKGNLTKWWSQSESNQRHKDFQSFALPTEL